MIETTVPSHLDLCLVADRRSANTVYELAVEGGTIWFSDRTYDRITLGSGS